MSGNNRIIVQERDLHLLRELATMRVIDRELAERVAPFSSASRANRRLLALFRAGLLRRILLGTTGGARKALYILSTSGANLVGVPYREPRRKSGDVLVADSSMTHQLRVNEVYVIVKCVPIPVPTFRFVRWLAFHEPLETGLSLVPDGYVEISSPIRTLASFVEVDLGTESRAVWMGKVRAYLRYAVSGHIMKQFGQAQFRVLVITPSEGRRDSLRAATARITQKIFWFTTFDSIRRSGFWSPIWRRCTGNDAIPLIQNP